jgi:hypothetical protein
VKWTSSNVECVHNSWVNAHLTSAERHHIINTAQICELLLSYRSTARSDKWKRLTTTFNDRQRTEHVYDDHLLTYTWQACFLWLTYVVLSANLATVHWRIGDLCADEFLPGQFSGVHQPPINRLASDSFRQTFQSINQPDYPTDWKTDWQVSHHRQYPAGQLIQDGRSDKTTVTMRSVRLSAFMSASNSLRIDELGELSSAFHFYFASKTFFSHNALRMHLVWCRSFPVIQMAIETNSLWVFDIYKLLVASY